MITSVELCRDELALVRRLGRQLRLDGASPVEIGEVIEEIFGDPAPRSIAMREAFRERIIRLHKIQRDGEES